jgi:hypothetical protein
MARSAALDSTGEPTSLPIMHSEHVLVIAAKSREIASISSGALEWRRRAANKLSIDGVSWWPECISGLRRVSTRLSALVSSSPYKACRDELALGLTSLDAM